MTTTYFARSALDELDHAQAELERHLAVRPNGVCATCGEVEPCAGRREAGVMFDRYGLLPRRRPGVAGVRPSGPNPAGTESHSWFGMPTLPASVAAATTVARGQPDSPPS
ncbi:hypothetical protein ACN27F_28945 [Solwaraspora sp. WMMB335]|uniref:hypothetical protein n=1 Tax=Solwaraspora sp. WMMB335 TaxID=3404118 RepID=UPI003B95B2F2